MRAVASKQWIVGTLALLVSAGAAGGVISAELASRLAQRSAGEMVPVIVQLADRIDPAAFKLPGRRSGASALLRALKDKAALGSSLLRPQLTVGAATNQVDLWMINAVAVRIPVWLVEELARSPLIGRIQYDAIVPFSATAAAAAVPSGSWNLDAVNAPALWALGVTGRGAVVANMDTGVDLAHPDLGAQWRGGGNSWFDPYSQHATPFDFHGHGTQTMGLMVGGAAGGTPIGMAPAAKWIAAKVFDDAGNATLSKLHEAFQWLLDPDGNPATLDAPDVVNASWGLTGMAPGSCNLEFGEDIRLLAAAGIMVVFSAGNDGPNSSTGASPADNPGALSVGAVDAGAVLDSISSRGPSGCDGTIFPKLVAPGVNVVSSDLSFGGLPLYASVSGTSFAAPHVTGAIALLISANSAASVNQLQAALTSSARDLGLAGADNAYGYGLLDAYAANGVVSGAGGAGSAPVITSTPPASATVGQPYSYQVTASDADGAAFAFSLATAPAGMAISAASGMLNWLPSSAQAGQNTATVKVADPTGLSASQTFSVMVAKPNTVPVGVPDSYSTAAGATLSVGAPGLLANDQDGDGDALSAMLASPVAHGVLALSAKGGFSYAPAAGYSGADSFSYRPFDGKAAGAPVTVGLTVAGGGAKPPVARDDGFNAPVFRSATYAPRVFNVLANDLSKTGQLLPSSVTVLSKPSKGGRADVNANGTIAYVPALRFTGSETFLYRVANRAGLWSNAATVTVRVQ